MEIRSRHLVEHGGERAGDGGGGLRGVTASYVQGAPGGSAGGEGGTEGGEGGEGPCAETMTRSTPPVVPLVVRRSAQLPASTDAVSGASV